MRRKRLCLQAGTILTLMDRSKSSKEERYQAFTTSRITTQPPRLMQAQLRI